MLIYLIDFDGKIENLALMRLSSYWKSQGAIVKLFKGTECPNLFESPDKVYISCLFRWNRAAAFELSYDWGEKAEIGGTGINIHATLPEEISKQQPDYSLYPTTKAIGFISRGCPQRCPWCVVPEKEGMLQRVSTASEIVGEFRDAIFLDNNFLALVNYKKDLEWLAKHKIKIDFNQGLDARLITEETAELLSDCKWLQGLRIALDSEHQISSVENALNLLDKAGYNTKKVTVFTLIGFSGFKSDVTRLLIAHKWHTNVFPMGFRDIDTGEEPANGWDKKLYKKFRRLIIRLPKSTSVWSDFESAISGYKNQPDSVACNNNIHKADQVPSCQLSWLN